MQSVSNAFTAEAEDSVRNIEHNLLVSWKKESTLGSVTFTIGVSTIGGNGIIGINPGSVGSPGIYRYFDESAYVTGMSWGRSLSIPVGGLVMGMAEAELDNTSGRFLPDFMGGNSELFTSILPRRPFIINAGFNFDGISQTIPQFSGILDRQPQVLTREKRVSLSGADYVDFFDNRFLDQEIMFTSFRSDEVYENLLQGMGLATSQYELDTGINLIPFGLFEKGTKYSKIFNELAQAEYGQFYQDEVGVFHFENRQHWDSSPHNEVQKIIHTAQVLDAEVSGEDHIINVVEINSKVMAKQPEQIIFRLNPFDSIEIPANDSTEVFVDFEDPALSMTTPSGNGDFSYYVATSNSDGGGVDLTSNVTIGRVNKFAKAAKISFSNSGSTTAYISTLVITGRIAATERNLYLRDAMGSSVTSYEERIYSIENPYIQNESWANSLAQMILADFSTPEKLQNITIRAIPSLQLGDLVSWQGRHWRIFGIESKLNPQVGFIQTLTLLQRTIQSYFRIGISTIGGSDKIAP